MPEYACELRNYYYRQYIEHVQGYTAVPCVSNLLLWQMHSSVYGGINNGITISTEL